VTPYYSILAPVPPTAFPPRAATTSMEVLRRGQRVACHVIFDSIIHFFVCHICFSPLSTLHVTVVIYFLGLAKRVCQGYLENVLTIV
jgi:hypothetical protein